MTFYLFADVSSIFFHSLPIGGNRQVQNTGRTVVQKYSKLDKIINKICTDILVAHKAKGGGGIKRIKEQEF